MMASALRVRMTPFRILPEEELFSAVVMRLFATLIMAFRTGLKTAIPHSIRRNVLNPRLALWPRTPMRMATAIGNTTSRPDVVEHSNQLLMGHL
jgi:hypothetical protein